MDKWQARENTIGPTDFFAIVDLTFNFSFFLHVNKLNQNNDRKKNSHSSFFTCKKTLITEIYISTHE